MQARATLPDGPEMRCITHVLTHLLDVEAACEHIGCDEHARAAVPEVRCDRLALFLHPFRRAQQQL
jgi:hypothetical protein